MGVLFLLLFLSILALMYNKHMQEIYKDIAEKEAQEIAEKKFRAMLRTAKVKVVQRLEIVDEMRR